jgi:hypothetical protein
MGNLRWALALAATGISVGTAALLPSAPTAGTRAAMPPKPAIGPGWRDLARPGVSSDLRYGRQRIVGTTFRDIRSRGICQTTAFVVDGVARSQSGSGCHPLGRAGTALAAEPILLSGLTFSRRTVTVLGLVRADITGIVARRPRSRVDISVSAPFRLGEDDGPDQLAVRSLLLRIWEGDTLDLTFRSGSPMFPPEAVDLVALFANLDMSIIELGPTALNGKRFPRMLDAIAESGPLPVTRSPDEETARL